MTQVYRTLRVVPSDEGVLGVVIDAPPMNLIGPELVHDLVGLLGALESDQETRVVVLESADPDYFVPHVDLTKVAEYTAEAAKAGGPGDASLGMLWHKLSELPVVTIAKLRGILMIARLREQAAEGMPPRQAAAAALRHAGPAIGHARRSRRGRRDWARDHSRGTENHRSLREKEKEDSSPERKGCADCTCQQHHRLPVVLLAHRCYTARIPPAISTFG